MARKKKVKRPKPAKVPIVGGKALPGRPRRDGLPPIQKKALLTPQDKAALADKVFLGRIGYLAGIEGLPPKFIAVKIRHEYPAINAVTEDFEPQGRFYEAAMLGMANAVGEVGAAFHGRARDATGKGIEPLFFMKCRGDWAETAVARQKLKAADEDDTVEGIEVEVYRS